VLLPHLQLTHRRFLAQKFGVWIKNFKNEHLTFFQSETMFCWGWPIIDWAKTVGKD
jgi:choline-glycine betaine transporter